jgi:hypothetical protein
MMTAKWFKDTFSLAAIKQMAAAEGIPISGASKDSLAEALATKAQSSPKVHAQRMVSHLFPVHEDTQTCVAAASSAQGYSILDEYARVAGIKFKAGDDTAAKCSALAAANRKRIAKGQKSIFASTVTTKARGRSPSPVRTPSPVPVPVPAAKARRGRPRKSKMW